MGGARRRLFHIDSGEVLIDSGEVLEPALRADKAFDVLGHRARIEVVHNEQPGGIVDDHLTRPSDVGGDLFRITRLLDLIDQRIEFRVLPIGPVETVGREGAGGRRS